MNEEMIIAEETTAEAAAEPAADTTEALISELEAVKAENTALRRKIFCSEKNIPAEIAADIICIAENTSAREGISFEDAAEAAYRRIMKLCTSKTVTTGAAVKKASGYGGDPLRSAFGLKN